MEFEIMGVIRDRSDGILGRGIDGNKIGRGIDEIYNIGGKRNN
jgi:hypothetical protein